MGSIYYIFACHISVNRALQALIEKDIMCRDSDNILRMPDPAYVKLASRFRDGIG
jgi:hypothetical protein